MDPVEQGCFKWLFIAVRLEARYEVVVVASDEGVASERRSATASLTILGLESRDKGPPCSQV